jgi:hypothetical protein
LIDWRTGASSAVSFLLHFVLLGAIYSDWCDPVVDDEIAIAGLIESMRILGPPPSIEAKLSPDDLPDAVLVHDRPHTVDQPAEPDGADIEALSPTDLATAVAIKRAKSALESLDSTLRNFGSRTFGAGRAKGNAMIQGVSLTSGVVSNAARVVSGMRAGFRACYQRGLRESPDAEGRIQLTLQIGPTGEVTAVAPVASGNLPATVLDCVTTRARLAQFAAPDDGAALIQVPVSFLP